MTQKESVSDSSLIVSSLIVSLISCSASSPALVLAALAVSVTACFLALRGGSQDSPEEESRALKSVMSGPSDEDSDMVLNERFLLPDLGVMGVCGLPAWMVFDLRAPVGVVLDGSKVGPRALGGVVGRSIDSMLASPFKLAIRWLRALPVHPI